MNTFAGRKCLKEALTNFIKEPLLPLTWDVISKLEIVEELQNQTSSTSVVLTKNNTYNTIRHWIDSYFNRIGIEGVRGFVQLRTIMESLVQSVDKVTALIKEYSAQTRMDDSYFM